MTDSNHQSTCKQKHLTEQSIALPLNMFTYLFKLAELRGELKQLNPHACMGSYLS